MKSWSTPPVPEKAHSTAPPVYRPQNAVPALMAKTPQNLPVPIQAHAKPAAPPTCGTTVLPTVSFPKRSLTGNQFSAPPIYKPQNPTLALQPRMSPKPQANCTVNLPRSAIRSSQSGMPVQLRTAGNSLALENRPAPPVYRPENVHTSLQPRTTVNPLIPVPRPSPLLHKPGGQQQTPAAGLVGHANVQMSGAEAGLIQMRRKKKKSNRPQLDQMGRRARRRWFQQQRERRARALVKADSTAWRISVEASRPELAGGVPITITAAPDELRAMELEADTDIHHGAISVRYDPGIHTRRDMDRRIGRFTQTFTHELAVHGISFGGAGDKEADLEHREMHGPATREPYLRASRRAFNRLQNSDQQQAFVNAWFDDVNNQIAWDQVYNEETGRITRLNEHSKATRRAWALERRNSMIDAITRPDDHDWTND